jgi:proline racemase
MLSYTRTVQTIDAHTGGEPLRIVVSGLPKIPPAPSWSSAPGCANIATTCAVSS